ncbi:chromosome condensation complex Condensin, subunit G [Mycoemilia scoparia]|uniref:Chromosome condensation complex Condensin, subunit G n=1 Tax=Mycoemilia scoparia TaxID=417184 RepID=A0A9W8DW80_9FUNG|nr:chromosome condensation complex Condensin, subunit G [Mycoemilia scoparia]
MSSLEEISKTLRENVPVIFNQAQKKGAAHRKLVLALYKLQMQCAKISDPENDSYVGEEAFNEEFIRNLNKLLAVKKREQCVDRSMKLIATFVQLAYEKDTQMLEELKKGKKSDDVFGQDNEDEYEAEETVFSRFIEFLICYLLRGFSAKEKMVRLRCCQLVAMTITCLGEMDESLYIELVKKLSDRIRDKESSIRVHAAISLSKLQGSDDSAEGQAVTKRLLRLLHYDPNAEVRRAVLLNIAKTKTTLPYILERASDVDVTNRKYFFLRVLPVVDFRALSIESREKVLTAGINDRDPNVKQACVRMLGETWLQTVDQNLLELIESLDVVDSPIADDAIKALFQTYPEIPNNLTFNDEILDNLTPETSFLIRMTLEHFSNENDNERLDASLPEVLKLAQLTSSFVSKLENETDEDLLIDHEYVIRQLLMITRLSDFPDELGRRHVLTLMRQMLVLPGIPENSIEIITDILKKLSISERDFTSMVVEVLSDIRESVDSDVDPNNDEAKQEQIVILIKCLVIIKYLLQRCQEPLNQNTSIYGLLSEYIVPAIQSSESMLQGYGVQCLLLCCVLDKTLAVDNITLFIQAAMEGTIELCIMSLKALLDLTFVHGIQELSANLEAGQLLELLLAQLEHENDEIQSIACEGLAKLLYAHRIAEPAPAIEKLLVLYYHPSTISNHVLRQSMAYFFPAYCYSHSDNQSAMQSVAVEVLSELTTALEEYPDAQGVTPANQISQQLVAWCDPRIAQTLSSLQGGKPKSYIKMDKYSQMGNEALKKLFVSPLAVRKSMIQFLNRLALDESTPIITCQQLFIYTRAAIQKPVVTDALSKNALVRFEKGLLKILGVEDSDDVNIESWLEDPEMEEVFDFIAGIAEGGEEYSDDDNDNDNGDEEESDTPNPDASVTSKAREPDDSNDEQTAKADISKRRRIS